MHILNFFILYYFTYSFDSIKLCKSMSLFMLLISPANIADSYIFRKTSFGALLPIFNKPCLCK